MPAPLNLGSIAAGESPWRACLYQRLRCQPYPLLVCGEASPVVTPAASLWAGTRLWINAFREAGLKPGSRVAMALPASAAFLQASLACFWEGLTLAPLPPTADLSLLAETLDFSATIGSSDSSDTTWTADPSGLPLVTGQNVRDARIPPTPEARLLMATSGTTSAGPRWIALSDANLWSVLRSHLPRLGLLDASGQNPRRVLSALPWHHVFGLVIDLLPAVLAGCEIVRDPSGGRDPERMIQLMREESVTHLNMVPLTAERILQTPGGPDALSDLRGGVIGGAPVNGALAESLNQTRLIAGYGQTEASPGISLGQLGRWSAGYIGRPLGCSVAIGDTGTLRFSGPNACLGVWTSADGLQTVAPDRWVETGDLVRYEDGDLYFVARFDDAFKLSNGRRVQAGLWQDALLRQMPQLRHALLATRDGTTLELWIGTRPGSKGGHHRQEFADVLGSLGARLTAVRELPPEQWILTPKGDVSRMSMLKIIADSTDVN